MNQGLPQIISEAQEEFDNEVDRLVTRSLRDPSCKPLTELKGLIASQITKACEEMGAVMKEQKHICSEKSPICADAVLHDYECHIFAMQQRFATEQERLISNFLKPV